MCRTIESMVRCLEGLRTILDDDDRALVESLMDLAFKKLLASAFVNSTRKSSNVYPALNLARMAFLRASDMVLHRGYDTQVVL